MAKFNSKKQKKSSFNEEKSLVGLTPAQCKDGIRPGRNEVDSTKGKISTRFIGPG